MNKNTQELLKLLKNSRKIESYLSSQSKELQDFSLPEYLDKLLKEKNFKKSQCILEANLQRNYGYQIFSGERTPSRDKLLSLCIAMRLTPEETHSLLCSTGFADLYPKNKRDSILIFSLEKHFNVLETNELLYDLGEKTLDEK